MENTPMSQTEDNNSNKQVDTKKWIIIAIVVIVGLMFIKMIFSAENIAENMIEQATDGEYNVDIDRDGSMQFTNEDGEQMNIVSGKSATLPDKWPSSVPVLSDANIVYSATVGDGQGGQTYTVTYTTDQDAVEVISFYKEELISNDWTIEVTMDTGDGSMLSASNEDDEGVMVNVGESEDGITVVVSAQMAE